MKKSLIMLAAFALTTAFPSMSEETEMVYPSSKNWSIGFSSYALVVSSDDYGDDDFSGVAFSGNHFMSDNIGFQFELYVLEHQDFSGIEVTGADLLAYYGSGLLSEGFKWYIGGGFYSETLEVGRFEEDFSGGQLNVGLGYNWESVGLDLSSGLRTTSDYEDSGDDITAITASLSLSYRF
jgi:hypothetical protein